MIRINLLGIPHSKRGKRSAMGGGGGGEGGSPIAVIAVLALIVLGVNGWYYWHLTSIGKQIASDMAKAEIENQNLSKIKIQYDALQAQAKQLDDREHVINDLRAKQSGPVDLLTKVGETVNQTDGVWLLTMKDDGNNISLDGTALGANAVANLITNLKKANYFKSVEIKETYQDDQMREVQAFQFTLVCEKQPPPAPPQQEKKS
jgi:Tfp pilus assembly protein PilN